MGSALEPVPGHMQAPFPWAEVVRGDPDPACVPDPEHRARIAATGLPWSVRHREIGIELLLVPPGEYWRGATDDDDEASEDEFPRHRVRIDAPFYLARHELTQLQWWLLARHNPSTVTGPGQPVTDVDLPTALGLLARVGLSLPREAEWEYACRAGSEERRYGPLEQVAWSWENSPDGPLAVDSLQRNPWGFSDMLGNVAEWTRTPYDPDFYARIADEDRPVQAILDDEAVGELFVVRGGSWRNGPSSVRASRRVPVAATDRFSALGLRPTAYP
jgi:formylglycine-generating enzyme required for sulfatase activity